MWLNLVYNSIIYNNFLISEDGRVKNVKTNHIYKNYTNNKGYPEILIAIFYEKDKIDLASGPVESELLSKYL